LKSKKLFAGLIGAICALAGVAYAGPAEQTELDDIARRQEQIDLKRDWIKYRLDEKQQQCYEKFFTAKCLDEAQLLYRREMREIRAQETLMHDRQRALRAIIKDEKYQERQENRADPLKEQERRDNVKNYEQKQIDAAKRQADVDKKRADAKARANENNK
jgi:hypothetical protein